MIFPILNGFANLSRAPITYLIFALNLVMLGFTFQTHFAQQAEIEKIVDDEMFLRTGARLYGQYLEQNGAEQAPLLRGLAASIQSGGDERERVLGGLALRDGAFLSQVKDLDFVGDQVARSWWIKRLKDYQVLQLTHPSYILGINDEDVEWPKWLTYQFVHSGFVHFIGNMVFLLIFGSMLEPMIGGLALLVSYLGSGMVAAGFFLAVSGASAIPLIGASGAISGVVALFCVMFWNTPVRYFYFLFIPKKGFAGIVYLPGWVAITMWLLSDLAGFLGTSNELGGVAYTAHLGGELAGALVAVALLAVRKSQSLFLSTGK